MVFTQFQNVAGNDLEQFQTARSQPILWPPEYKTGDDLSLRRREEIVFPPDGGGAQSFQIESIRAHHHWWSMIFSENRFPPPDRVRAGFFRIMLQGPGGGQPSLGTLRSGSRRS